MTIVDETFSQESLLESSPQSHAISYATAKGIDIDFSL